jgi:arylsulfatase A-like enzyme
MRRFSTWILFAFLPALLFLHACEKEQPKPNILLILTDDQAYGDLSITGNPYLETPVLDKLSTEGANLTNFYVSPVCAPTRASLLTGRYPQRTGVSGVTRGRENMRLDEVTLADYLKEAGYATGCFGKWHNGAHYPYHPLGRGFDEFYGFTSGHKTNYFNGWMDHNGKQVKGEGFIIDDLTSKAIEFMQKNADQNRPFFCFVPYSTPHTPIQVEDSYFEKYKAKGLDDFNAGIYAMCENIDDNVGRLLDQLSGSGIKEETIVIFLSDNGPLNFRYNAGLKGRKGDVDEGGMKVPCFINWPGHIKAKMVIEQNVAHIDLLPTLLDLLGQKPELAKKIDGVSLAQVLKGQSVDFNRRLYQEWSGKKRVLDGRFVMVNESLYDLQTDPGQQTDIRNDFPELYDDMMKDWKTWYADVSEKGFEVSAIPVGHPDFPQTILPAHEANLLPPFEFRKDRRHTGIAYHALYGWAHDWIDHWTKTDAWAEWPVEILSPGEYVVDIFYNLDSINAGVKLEISCEDEMLVTQVNEPFVSPEVLLQDRVKRDQEAPEKEWKTHQAGIIKLQPGLSTLLIKTLEIPGRESIELKEIHLTRIN